jgi:hypothetical protein
MSESKKPELKLNSVLLQKVVELDSVVLGKIADLTMSAIPDSTTDPDGLNKASDEA